eukprot:TRINITY_DN27003_c0_g1_i1.p1 TRINITY_DN27003_c0_g1~~TRINITY_DN27003_c0_g1_i1.p1  ORF type:complete len:155 (-),score=15.90 TRINITY_DN27003_c0_g1_i1:1147-1611(-)
MRKVKSQGWMRKISSLLKHLDPGVDSRKSKNNRQKDQQNNGTPIKLDYTASIQEKSHSLEKRFELLVIIDISSPSATTYIVVVFQDITQRLENLALKKISEYKSRLMASVSHELRTPLNGSIAMLEHSLQDDRIPDDSKHDCLRPALDCMNYLL